MRVVSKKLRKTALLAFLTSLFFTYLSCSQLESISKSSIKFSLSSPRAAITLAEGEQVFIDLSLQGEYSDTQSAEITNNDELIFTFENVPVGKEIKAFAQIYTLYQNEKLTIYEGLSDSKKIQEEENIFTISLALAYDSYVESSESYIVLRPLLTKEHNKQKLTTNKLTFNLQNEDESFSWKYEAMDSFQKAQVTFKGLSLSSDAENKLRFRLVKSKTGTRYPLETRLVSNNSQTYEFEIPQYIGLDEIALENDWNTLNNSWASDFSCSIDKILLLKDQTLLDPDFNVISKTENSYTVQKPALQKIVYTNISKNTIEFDSRQGIYEDNGPYSAAYWEYENLDQYDKATIYVKALHSDEGADSGRRFVVKGYSPADLSAGKNSSSSEFIEVNNFLLTSAGASGTSDSGSSSNSQIFVVNIADLKNGLEGDLTAIEFQNNSGNWDSPDDDNSWAPWSMEIEKIILSVIGEYSINVTVAGSSDIEVSESNITNDQNRVTGKRFTAPEGYTSYIWKVDGQVQTNVTGNVFDFDMSELITGKIYDITLLASNETFNHSWNAQVRKE